MSTEVTVSKESKPQLLQSTGDHRKTELTGSFFDLVCDDALLRILGFADLTSLVFFTRVTSKCIRNRLEGTTNTPENLYHCSEIWRGVFAGHNLAPIEPHEIAITNHFGREGSDRDIGKESTQIDYVNIIRRRLLLFSNLSTGARRAKLNSRNAKPIKQCFSLPSRYFHFVPLVPAEMMRFPPQPNATRSLHFDRLDYGDAYHVNDFGYDGDVNMDDTHTGQNEGRDDGDEWDGMDFDPPPVEFACESYSLSSPGTGEELALLNPFSGSIEVYESVHDNAIGSDASLLERAMLDASERIIRKRRHCSLEDDFDAPDENSEEIAGEAIHYRVQQNNRDSFYDTPPKQILFSVQDYFNIDLYDYFGQNTPFGADANFDLNEIDRGGVTVDWIGIDTHVALDPNNMILSRNMIGAARILTVEAEREEEDLVCTEVIAWSKFNGGLKQDSGGAVKLDSCAKYESKYICRATGSFHYLDICASFSKVYALFEEANGSSQGNNERNRRPERARRPLVDIDNESLVDDDGEPVRGTRHIVRLPLIKYNEPPTHPRSYFPSPEAWLSAEYPVASFLVDPTGETLVVGTVNGTVEIWDTGLTSVKSPAPPRRLQTLSIRDSFLRRARSMTIDGRFNSKRGMSHNTNDDQLSDNHLVGHDSPIETEPYDNKVSTEFNLNETATQDDLALLGSSSDDYPHKHPTSKISEIFLPRHLPVYRCGFVTKQRNVDEGTTLLLWQKPVISHAESSDHNKDWFQIVAMINLPLSFQCDPQIHFDGRRLVVFGKDHIGLIFLIYHTLSTRFDQHNFDDIVLPVSLESPPRNNLYSSKGGNKGEESGGVVNLHPTGERRIKFVNRIRHAGLGGLEYYDSMQLTANERFLVVNTKTGNLVGSDGARNASQGLLVIDLQEHRSY